ncbi:MAG TPA: hypothetical protein VGW38_14670, partial [Chloroflexota bacterium]|nr:hypothetical protein [Chloroflexota bacterium]
MNKKWKSDQPPRLYFGTMDARIVPRDGNVIRNINVVALHGNEGDTEHHGVHRMNGLPSWTTRAASPRGLLSLALVLGTLSGYAGRGTLAFFTSSVVSQANAFSGGIVDIAGDFTATGSTASVLTKTAFSWTSIGAHNNTTTSGANPDTNQDCANILTGLDVRTQGMAPGNYCVAKIDLNNTNTNAIDAWMRIRVVRSTPASWNSDTQISSGSEALNDRLKLYMHEYSGAAEGATGNKLARDANCTTAGYKPTWTGPTATASAAGTAQFNSVPGTSSGKIRSLTSTSGTAGADERLSGTGYTS